MSNYCIAYIFRVQAVCQDYQASRYRHTNTLSFSGFLLCTAIDSSP